MLNISSLPRGLKMNYPKFDNKDYLGLNGTTKFQLTHPHFEQWQNWFIEDYEPPNERIALFIPCAAIKPYYNSPIHKEINKKLDKYADSIHKIVISNAGVIPYEYSDKYPFNSYDWNPLAESDAIQNEYYEITKSRILKYLQKHEYINYVSYLRSGSISFNALNDSCKELGKKLIHSNLNEIIDEDKDTDLILTYPENLDLLQQMLEDIL